MELDFEKCFYLGGKFFDLLNFVDMEDKKEILKLVEIKYVRLVMVVVLGFVV